MSPHRTLASSSTAPRRSTRYVVAVLMGAGLAVAAPSAAHARTVTDTDKPKDVVKVDQDSEAFEKAPRYRLNDVMSTELTHTAEKVTVKMTLARLKKTEAFEWRALVYPAKGYSRVMTLRASDGSWSGVLEVTDIGGGLVDCGNHKISYKADTVRITLPRDCVGRGRWVKFQALAVTHSPDRLYGDDAMLDRPLKESDTDWAWSARVYRGR